MKRRTAPPHLVARVNALRRRMAKWRVDAVLVTNPFDIRYLTGFVGDDSWALIMARSSGVAVLSDFRFEEQIAREAPHVMALMRKKGLADDLASILKRRRCDRLGVQAQHMTLAVRKAVARKLSSRLVPVDDRLLEQRSVKDRREVNAIRKALAVTQKAYQQTIRRLEPGQTEKQIAAELEYHMRRLGADGMAFASIVAADANGSLPHAIPGAAKVKRGGTVLFDWGAVVDGYCGDLTRVVALGRMKPKLREIYRIVLDAHDAAISAVAPGALLSDVDAVARRWIEQAGYGPRFGHSLGHGIGLQVHEQPVLSERSTGTLEPGHVVTIEPGIYLPGVGGVRIEDDVLVTARGHEVLSDLPTSLESAII